MSAVSWTQRLAHLRQVLRPKNDDINIVSAAFHTFTITLISMSMVDLEWFTVTGNVCVQELTIGQFFTFKYSDVYEYPCITYPIINMMRLTIGLCFLAISFALFGFFVDIRGSTNIVFRLSRRYVVPGTCSTLWIMAVISISYYIILLLEESIENHYSKANFTVTYGRGFYLFVAAGAVNSIGIIYNLIQNPTTYQRDDDRCILEEIDNDPDAFNSPTPPPPYNLPLPPQYNIPPPPYTP